LVYTTGMQKETKTIDADEIRHDIEYLTDMRDQLNHFYDRLPDREQTSLNLGIEKINLTLNRMARRLVQQRMKEAIG